MRSAGIRLSGRPVGSMYGVGCPRRIGTSCGRMEPVARTRSRCPTMALPLPRCKPRREGKGRRGMHVHMRKRAAVTLAVRSISFLRAGQHPRRRMLRTYGKPPGTKGWRHLRASSCALPLFACICKAMFLTVSMPPGEQECTTDWAVLEYS